MITDLSFRFVFIACSITFARAFASQLTGDHCTKPMNAGEIMMGQPAKSDETYRLQLHRLDMTEVLNGGMK